MSFSEPLSKSSQIIFGLVFFGIFITVGICIFISDNPGLYVGLMIGFAGPFGILGFSLLFSNSRKRGYGLLSPFILKLCGMFCIVMGIFMIFEEPEAKGLSACCWAFIGAVNLFALAHKRSVQHNKNGNYLK